MNMDAHLLRNLYIGKYESVMCTISLNNVFFLILDLMQVVYDHGLFLRHVMHERVHYNIL